MLKIKLAAIGAFILGVLLAFLKMFKAGKKAKEQEIKEEVLENVQKAKKAHDKYQSDDDYADRMRDKYSRK